MSQWNPVPSSFRVRNDRRSRRRRAAIEPLRAALEERLLLSVAVPIPASNPRVALATIFWNGEPTPLNPAGKSNVPSPEAAGAMKTVTIINSGPETIYPFLRSQNIGVDPNADPPAPYDPQDLVDHEFREYVGYGGPGGRQYLGLPPGASITIQVPLVLWDGDNLYLTTDGAHLTSPHIFGYDPTASVSVAAAAPVDGSTWVQGSGGYPAAATPLVMFYYSDAAPLTLPNDAPSQLTELTFRDPYLKNFVNDPNQTFPLINYDVSYVNNLVAPVSMEASHVPITYGDPNQATPPEYFGYQDFGWLATNRDVATFQNAIKDFVNNAGASSVGRYFGGKGWPEYYNPAAGVYDVPAGSNLFANSPLTTGSTNVNVSSYDSNRWQLTSAGDAPITAGGAGVGVQGFVRPIATNRIELGALPPSFLRDLRQMLADGTVDVKYPGSQETLATVTGIHPNPGGRPYVTLSAPITATGPSGGVFAFTREPSDYAVTAITNLWYSWANYHVQQFQDFVPETVSATLGFSGTYASNVITLASQPAVPLAVGMTVTAPSGVPAGTTILKIDGDQIFLSRIPDDDAPASQVYTFGKPRAIAYDPKYTTPYQLSFDAAATPGARLFAGSVYAAMSAEAGVDPLPPSSLPYSMNLVSQVIQFYAKLPGYDRAGNPAANLLVGEVRDVVKSILRGVYDFNAVPDQSLWYPAPGSKTSGLTSGQDFNVFNLDPYVWFVHDVEQMSAYGFSIDDDVANPTATGPLVAPDGSANHFPNNLQIEFGGAGRLGNTSQWFPTIPWGTITTQATIGVQPTGKYKGCSIVTFTGPDALRLYNQINNPGDGQVGATISAPGFIQPGTTLIFKGPTSGDLPQIVLSKRATSTDTPIQVTITAGSQQSSASGPLFRRLARTAPVRRVPFQPIRRVGVVGPIRNRPVVVPWTNYMRTGAGPATAPD